MKVLFAPIETAYLYIMRKVTFAINMSIDGCVDHTSFNPDEELFEYFISLMHDVDLIAYGRKMYELMFPYWADPANRRTKPETEFAETITGMEKIVFSRSLESAGYNTRIIRTDPVEELLKLKQAPGKNISVDTISMLPLFAKAGLVDEYHFIIHPAIVGQGVRLIENGSLAGKLNLKLVGSRAFNSGCMALQYLKQGK